MMTPRLEQLMDGLRQMPERPWIVEVLLSCLERLGSGGPTSWDVVEVVDAWVDAHALHIVYTSPWGPVAGLIRGADSPASEDPWECGRMIADFDVAEPLGTVVDHLVYDESGVGWWGDPVEGSILGARRQGPAPGSPGCCPP